MRARAFGILLLIAGVGLGVPVSAEDAVHASLEDLAWMSGSWAAENPRGSMEERWSPIAGSSLVGVFRSVNSGKMSMTELLIIEQEGEELHLRLQQFNPGFVARSQPVHFVAVEIGERNVVFRNQGSEGLYELNYNSQGPGDFRIRGRQAKGGEPFELVLAGK